MTKKSRNRFMAPLDGEQLRAQMLRTRPSAQAPSTFRLETTGRVARMHLYGLIGGWFGDILAEDVVPAIRELDVDTIELYINSPGGDAYDGIAIANALREHSARTEAHVDGLAASAASVIAAAADDVIMGPGSQFMIHDAWGVGIGNSAALHAEANVLDQLSAGVASLYAAKAGGTADSWRDLMIAETWYSAEEAVAAGLADRIAGGSSKKQNRARIDFDLSAFTYAGRANAPAPAVLRPAAMAPTERNTEMNRAQLAAALAAGTITQEQPDTHLEALEAFEAQLAVTPPPLAATDPEAAARRAEIEAGPVLQTVEPRPVVTTSARMTDPREFDRHMAAVGNDLRGGDPKKAVWLALDDVLPGDDAGEAFVSRPDWLGQTWRASDESRDWIDALGEPGQLNAIRSEGWNWGVVELDEDDEPTGAIVAPFGPEVDDYAGDKAELPSNPVKTFKQEFESFIIAAAWDVERRYVDFGSEAFWRSFREEAVKSYKRKSNSKVRTLIRAAAPDAATGGAADVVFGTVGISGVLQQLRADIRSVSGAHANRVFLGATFFDAIENLLPDATPLWLKNATVGAGPEEGKAETDQLFIRLDTTLGAKESVVFDSRGIKYRERSPFWVEALNVPKGGVDIAVHSYGQLEIHDERVIKSRVYA